MCKNQLASTIVVYKSNIIISLFINFKIFHKLEHSATSSPVSAAFLKTSKKNGWNQNYTMDRD